jgi:hypothetical protein
LGEKMNLKNQFYYFGNKAIHKIDRFEKASPEDVLEARVLGIERQRRGVDLKVVVLQNHFRRGRRLVRVILQVLVTSSHEGIHACINFRK